MPLTRSLQRTTVVGALLFAVGFGLSGCVAAPTGRTAAATDRQIESVPGVEKASVSPSALLDGFTSRQIVMITVTVSDGYHVGDADAAIVWLAREAWSVGPRRPGSMGVSLEDSSGKPLAWGWKAALAKRGWDVPLVDDDMADGGNIIGLANSRMTSLTGKNWHGSVPKTPANLFVKNSS